MQVLSRVTQFEMTKDTVDQFPLFGRSSRSPLPLCQCAPPIRPPFAQQSWVRPEFGFRHKPTCSPARYSFELDFEEAELSDLELLELDFESLLLDELADSDEALSAFALSEYDLLR